MICACNVELAKQCSIMGCHSEQLCSYTVFLIREFICGCHRQEPGLCDAWLIFLPFCWQWMYIFLKFYEHNSTSALKEKEDVMAPDYRRNVYLLSSILSSKIMWKSTDVKKYQVSKLTKMLTVSNQDDSSLLEKVLTVRLSFLFGSSWS